MLRTLTRARAAWASTAVLTLLVLLSHAPIAGAFNPPYTAPTWYYAFDDFEGIFSPPPAWQTVLGTWSVAGGTYNSTAAVSTAVTTIFDYPDYWYGGPVDNLLFGDYRLYARMLNQSAAGSTVGLVYGYKDPANYREAVFSANTASLRVVVDGVATTVASARYQGGGQGVWFDVELIVDAGTSTVRIKGIDLLTRVATPVEGLGQVGLSTHNALAKFDNFSIEVPVGERPFQEDFDNGTSQHLTALAGQWSAAAGTYNSGTVQQTSIALTPASGDLYVMENFALRTRMLNPYGASGNLVGIVFNYRDSGNYDEVVFSPTGIARINQVVDGTLETLATATYGGHRNEWFDVTFYMQFTGVSVAVNGKMLFEHAANPTMIPDGYLGLITHWAPGKFDDMWFGYTDPPPLSEGFDAGLPSGWSLNGTWSANQGILDASTVAVTASATAPGSAPRDYVLRARMLNQYGASGNLVGLMYQGSASQGKGDRFEVVFAPTGQAYLDKYIQGVRYRIATATHNIPRNTWFDVELTRSGPDTTVKVNGVTVFNHVPQGQLPSGTFGLVTHWAKARFDNVSMSPLPD
jgi:3-keto-disaccharide hydrolase